MAHQATLTNESVMPSCCPWLYASDVGKKKKVSQMTVDFFLSDGLPSVQRFRFRCYWTTDRQTGLIWFRQRSQQSQAITVACYSNIVIQYYWVLEVTIWRLWRACCQLAMMERWLSLLSFGICGSTLILCEAKEAGTVDLCQELVRLDHVTCDIKKCSR